MKDPFESLFYLLASQPTGEDGAVRSEEDDVGDAVEYEGLGGLAETDLLVEAFRVFLGLDVDDPGIEMLPGRGDALQHDPLAIALAPLCCDDSADGNLFHVGSGRAYTSQGDKLVFDGQP